MRLNLHADYALRLLMLLALEPAQIHSVEAVSRRYAISQHHMNKVAQTLVRAGLVDGRRGRGGGLRLARPPATINLGDVLRIAEDNFALVECFDQDRSGCVLAPACALRGVLDEALAAFFAVLDRYSLADLVSPRRRGQRMRALLGTVAAGAA